MRVLVTGANGMLGQDLCPIFEDAGYDVIETDKNNLDIINSENVEQVISKENPDLVIHCAAYTNVDGAEGNYEEALLINEKGTDNVARACAIKDIPIVYISTDYVFDGEKETPYLVSDKPNPINKYGLTKLRGEEAAMSHSPKFYIVRTSWLYGHHGKNFVEVMISLKDKEELLVVNDQVGSPTWVVDLSEAILNMIQEEKPYGVYQFSGSGVTTWYEFAKEIFSQLGVSVNLKPCTSQEYQTVAKRPKYSVMDTGSICRGWKEALRDYMNLRSEE